MPSLPSRSDAYLQRALCLSSSVILDQPTSRILYNYTLCHYNLQQYITMGLKRKRSSPTFSSPASDSSGATNATTSSSSPLQFFYSQSKPVDPLYQKPTWSFPTYDEGLSSQHLNSRTRKRHRDDRPEDELIYGMLLTWFDSIRFHEWAADLRLCREYDESIVQCAETTP